MLEFSYDEAWHCLRPVASTRLETAMLQCNYDEAWHVVWRSGMSAAK